MGTGTVIELNIIKEVTHFLKISNSFIVSRIAAAIGIDDDLRIENFRRRNAKAILDDLFHQVIEPVPVGLAYQSILEDSTVFVVPEVQ